MPQVPVPAGRWGVRYQRTLLLFHSHNCLLPGRTVGGASECVKYRLPTLPSPSRSGTPGFWVNRQSKISTLKSQVWRYTPLEVTHRHSGGAVEVYKLMLKGYRGLWV
ncbi:MAG: hypothetical protein KME26_03790 [Oscillatoria princeps RMCB-10]|nr:hypothetical protein [Oscillatoria princeps RMCB-10]